MTIALTNQTSKLSLTEFLSNEPSVSDLSWTGSSHEVGAVGMAAAHADLLTF